MRATASLIIQPPHPPVFPRKSPAATTSATIPVISNTPLSKGCYAPVNPIAGFLNTVKGGAIVALKFEVFVNGVEQTSTAGFVMTVRAISCDTSAAATSSRTVDYNQARPAHIGNVG